MIDKDIAVWIGNSDYIWRRVKISQYDTDWRFKFTVYEGNEVYSIPSGSVAVLNGKKKDGTVFTYAGSILDNIVTVVCDKQISSAAGEVECELRISSGGRIVGSANFIFDVEASPISGFVLSENDFSALDQIVNQALESASIIGDVEEALEYIKSAVGSPLVASVVSDMTDHDKIYVYTGSEDGYTAGNWYYWDGAAWTSGGVYNAVAVNTDPTLSVEGTAADAKAAGDEITELKGTVSSIESIVTKAYDYSGISTNSLNISSSNKWNSIASSYVMYYFPVPSNAKVLTIKGNATNGSSVALLSALDTHTQGDTPVYATGWSKTSIPAGAVKTFAIPNDAANIWFIKTSNNVDYEPQLLAFDISIPEIDKTLSVSGKAADAKTVGDIINTIIPLNLAAGVSYTESTFIRYDNGNTATSDNTNATDYIDISGSTKLIYSKLLLTTSSSYVGIAFYNAQKQYISGERATLNGYSVKYFLQRVTVPETAVYIRLSAYKSLGGVVLYDADSYDNALTTAVTSVQTNKATGGYFDYTKTLVKNGAVRTESSVGDTITLEITENADYVTGIFSVKNGDRLRITGAAQGSGNVRLWCFTDSEGVVLSLAASFATEKDVELTASSDGYFVMNANASSVAYPPKFERYCADIVSAIDINNFNTNYDELNAGHDILSAFSNIMCCGDSLTASVVYIGVNGNENLVRSAYRRYPQILASKTGAEVEYHALGGYSASDWWTAYSQYIVQKTNQLAIIYLGTNGGLTDTIDTDAPGTDVSNYDKTTNTGAYCAIVKSFIDAGARVLLIHINKRNDNLFITNEVIDKIAEKFGCAVVTVPYLADDKYHLWPDGTGKNTLHYNDLGYAAFTESLIKNVGALNNTMMARLIPI